MTDAKDAPKPASTVLIVRDAQGPQKGLQVLMVRRSAGMAGATEDLECSPLIRGDMWMG